MTQPEAIVFVLNKEHCVIHRAQSMVCSQVKIVHAWKAGNGYSLNGFEVTVLRDFFGFFLSVMNFRFCGDIRKTKESVCRDFLLNCFCR